MARRLLLSPKDLPPDLFTAPPLDGHHQGPPKGPKVFLFYLIGPLGGGFGGLLGIGGGSAIAPLLLLITRMRPAQISGTTLATVFVISMGGSGAYLTLGQWDFAIAWPIAVGSITGSVLGALTSKRLSARVMIAILLVLLPYFAAKEFWPSLAAPDFPATIISLGLLGLAAGFFSGLLGISGASLLVPSLVAFFLIDHRAAQGIAISVALADSAAGVLTHARGRTINFRVLTYLAVPAFFAAVTAAFLSQYLPLSVLRQIFGGFTVTIWLLMFWRFMTGPSGTHQETAAPQSILEPEDTR